MTHLYAILANHLALSIEKGILRAGDKLPGVRTTSKNEGVSPSTVVSAYRHLEIEGYIKAKPRSGFYVRPRMRSDLAEPNTTKPVSRPKPVTGQELVLQLVQNINTPNIVQLGANIPDARFLPTRSISKSLSIVANRHRLDASSYVVPPGLPDLRNHIARRMSEIGCLTDADDIVVTSGCQEAIYLSLKSVTQPGDVVAIESPTYYGLLQAIEALGLKALEIPTHPRDGISVDALELALTQWPVKACVLIPNYSNPLGALMPDEHKRALAKLVDQHPGVVVIEDDIYGDLNFEGKRPSVLKSLDTNENMIYCSSLSKTVSSGLRIGWAISRKYKQQLAYEKFVTNCATSTISQLTAACWLDGGGFERHLRGMKIELARNTSRLIERIGKYFPNDVKVTRPRGGMVLWVELDKKTDSTQLSNQALDHGISIAPGQIFSSSPGKYRNCLRFNCAVGWNDGVENAIQTLGELIKGV